MREYKRERKKVSRDITNNLWRQTKRDRGISKQKLRRRAGNHRESQERREGGTVSRDLTKRSMKTDRKQALEIQVSKERWGSVRNLQKGSTEKGREGKRPVSYTHLTLPTKLSV